MCKCRRTTASAEACQPHQGACREHTRVCTLAARQLTAATQREEPAHFAVALLSFRVFVQAFVVLDLGQHRAQVDERGQEQVGLLLWVGRHASFPACGWVCFSPWLLHRQSGPDRRNSSCPYYTLHVATATGGVGRHRVLTDARRQRVSSAPVWRLWVVAEVRDCASTRTSETLTRRSTASGVVRNAGLKSWWWVCRSPATHSAMAAPRTAARVLVAAAIAATAVLCAVLSTTTAAVATTPPSYDPATTAIAGSHVDVTPGMASFGTALKGVGLHQGVEEELFNRTGAGTMTLMWFTGELIWPTFGDTRIRVYVDGETTPSLDFPVLLAVGQSQPTLQPWGQRRIGNLALSGGVYLTLRIPFGSGIRITAQLPDDEIIKGSKSFYFICRGMTNLPVTWGPLRLPPTARLRLQSLHGYEAAPLEEVRLYKSAVPGSGTGGGALALVTFHGISAKNLTYMEGEVRSYMWV